MEKAPAASAPPAEDDKLIEIQHAEPVEATWSLRRPRTRRNLFAAVGAAAIAGLIVGVVLGTMGAKAGGGDDKDDGGTFAPTAWEERRSVESGGIGWTVYEPMACRVGDRIYDRCCAGEPVHEGIPFQSGGSTLYNGTVCRRTLSPTLSPTPEPTTPRPTPEETSAPSISPIPTSVPLPEPTARPTPQPTPRPSATPTPQPTPQPTTPQPTPFVGNPTAAPAPKPTAVPAPAPTPRPSTPEPTPAPTPGPSPEPSPKPTPRPTPAPSVQPEELVSIPDSIIAAGVEVEISGPGELKLIMREVETSAGTFDAPCARSYDGRAWEATAAGPCEVACCVAGVNTKAECQNAHVVDDAAKCWVTSLQPGEGGHHDFKVVQVAAISAEAEAARFLTQATFGPTYDTMTALAADLDFAGWIAAQMALDPSLHRAHYRRRSHPRLTYADALVENSNWGVTSGGAAGPCDPDSRWRKFAFTTEDIGKTLDYAGNTLTVDGVARTTNATNVIHHSVLPIKICTVAETLLGEITLGNDCESPIYKASNGKNEGPSITTNYGDSTHSMLNPPIDHAPDVIGSVTSLTPIANVNDAGILGTMEDCSSPSYDDFGLAQIYLDVGGEYYAYDRRLVSQENSLKQPATTGTATTKCPAVPRTFLNEGSCVRAPGCGIATYSSKEIKLSADLRKEMYETTPPNYVYLVENLPVAEDPCTVNEKSRWVQDSCDDETPDADATLEAAINTDKLVQDVKLRTDSATACAAVTEGKYKIGSDCFRHGHPNEHNIYEFSQWVWDDMGNDMEVDWEALHDMADGSANSLTLAAGSTATFTWTDTHNVYEFPDAAAYNSCDFSGATEVGGSSASSVMAVDVMESAATVKYYGCYVSNHCDVGQKIAITWLAADYISQHATGDWVFDYGTTGNDQMYWEANRNKLTYVGTKDEIVPFNSLPLGLLSEELAGELDVGQCSGCDSDEACEDGDYCLENGDCDGGSCDVTSASTCVGGDDDGDDCDDDGDCDGDGSCDNVYVASSAADGFESCGSPGEVASDPSLGHYYPKRVQEYDKEDSGDGRNSLDAPTHVEHQVGKNRGRTNVWYTLMLNAPDQLRQRVAWALATVFIVSDQGVTNEMYTEPWTAFYDIFVRHAFGNLRDVLREISYHAHMAQYLTFADGAGKTNSKFDGEKYPDENYAREIMQLFSIGLYELDGDGTPLPTETYTNEDIVSFARAWTGFKVRPNRENLERGKYSGYNYVDPMVIDADDRDVFPKAKLGKALSLSERLRRGYLADREVLCRDVPAQAFLLKNQGKFVFQGKSKSFNEKDRPSWVDMEQFAATGALYDKLCAVDADGLCTFPSTVTLDEDITVDGLVVHTLRVVEVADAAQTFYYAWVPNVCADLAIAADPTILRATKSGKKDKDSQCGDPLTANGIIACCDDESDDAKPVTRVWAYPGERTTKANAQQRCEGLGMTLCAAWTTRQDTDHHPSNSVCSDDLTTPCSGDDDCTDPATCEGGADFSEELAWRLGDCAFQVQIDSEGLINVIHSVENDYDADENPGTLQPADEWELQVDSGNTYRGFFAPYIPVCSDDLTTPCSSNNDCTPATCVDDHYPQVADGSCAAESNCVEHGQTCVCDVTSVEETIVFDALPTRQDVLDQCYHKAAIKPSDVDPADGVEVYPPDTYDTDTIFGVTDETGNVIHLRNAKHTIKLGNYEMRNPPSHLKLNEPTSRDAAYETEALIDHLFTHDNAAAFFCRRLLQRLTTSNPSPTYLGAVTDAFRQGKYDGCVQGNDGCSHKYGDMGAAVATALLHPEARSTTLDADWTHGQLREPLLMICHFLRALEYQPRDGRQLELHDLAPKIGEEPHSAPSVFGYFQPEHQPAGAVRSAGLVSPEAELLTAPFILGLANGLAELVDYGLGNCNFGFGSDYLKSYGLSLSAMGRTCNNDKYLEEPVPNDGWLAYTPTATTASGIVEDLDLLLTSGRLSSHSRAIIEAAYDGSDESFKNILKLFTNAPEFHATNAHCREGCELLRPIKNPGECAGGECRQYRAVIVVFLQGGADSWNFLVPYDDQCDGGGGYQHYSQYRGIAALNKSLDELLPIDVEGQACARYGLHHKMPFLKQMYEEEQLSFFANVGNLVEPTTQQTFLDKDVELPTSIFAHNYAQRAAQSQDPNNDGASGILGRAFTMLQDRYRCCTGCNDAEADDVWGETCNGEDEGSCPSGSCQPVPFAARAYSASGTQKIFEDSPLPEYVVDATDGFVLYNDRDTLGDAVKDLTKVESESIYAETYAELFNLALHNNEALFEKFGDTMLTTATATNSQGTFDGLECGGCGGLAEQFKTVARLLKMGREDLGSERDGFYTQRGAWDTHNTLDEDVAGKVQDVDQSLEALVAELKAQDAWKDTTIVALSDFGRTLTSNGKGTDHAWGGNMFVLGGDVDGGKVHGTYPTDFATLDVGRGRLVPTMPWESMWHSIIDWLGVDVNDADELAHVLPNAANFLAEDAPPGWDLLKAEDVFKRESFAPTLTPVPTITPVPTKNSLMPEDCADPSIATYDELEGGFSHCTLHCDGVCELRLPVTDFKMEKDLEIMVSGRIYGGPTRPTIAPCSSGDEVCTDVGAPGVSDFDAGSYGAFKINAWDNPSMTMTFEHLRFAGWHRDSPSNDIRRIIYLQSGASMDIIDCIFEDNTVPMSAVYHVGGGPLLVASSIFRNNNAEENPGGVTIQNSGKGSAVTVTDGILEVRDSIFDSNTQYKQGAIYTWETLSINLTNCSFTDNEATDGRGGAVAFEVSDDEAMDRSSLHVQNCTFQGNQAEDEGGALYALRIKSVTISNCLFAGNKATDNDGGGAYVQRPQEDADDVLAAASRLDVRDTIFRANEAKDSGGGLYALQVSNVEINNCVFEDNKAKDEKGGGFYVLPYHQHTFSDVRVLRTSIRNNEAKGNGGGAFVGSAATTTFKDVVVEDNDATEGLGGGAYVTHSQNDADCRLDVLDSTFRTNNAAGNDGGGLYVLQMSTVKVDDCVFESNAAGAKGGGLYVQPHANQASSDVRVLSTVFRSNEASTNGGGAFVGTAVTTTFSDVDFLNNSAVGNGGAVNIGEHATGTAHFERVLVKRNTAGGDSGGIHFYRTSGSVRDSTFDANEADDTGGALGQDAQDGNEKDFLIETSTFTSNVAIAGGAVAFKQDMATITGCTFEDNRAMEEPGVSYGGRGGALFKGNGARLDLTDSTFLNNHAVRTDPDDSDTEGAGRGGAIYATGSTGSPTQGSYVGGCTFEGNVADQGGAAVASWLESWFFNASSFVDNVDASDDEGLMRLQKGHIIVRDCDFTTTQRVVDHTTSDSTLKVYCSPDLTSANVWVCSGCDATYDTTCGPVVDTNAFGFDVSWD